MTIKQFIEKAEQGGYKVQSLQFEGDILVGSIFLRPEAWKAVGKVSGWTGKACPSCGGKIVPSFGTGKNEFKFQCENCFSYLLADEWEGTWRYDMRRMIDALADGKTIEQFIETL